MQINPKSLRKRIFESIPQQEQCSQEELKAKVRKYYGTHKPSHVDSEIETLLLDLEHKGLVKLTSSGDIILTSSGSSLHQQYVSQLRIKEEKKKQAVLAEQRKKTIEEQKAESRSVHERIKVQVGELACLLGKEWKQEHKLVPGGPVIIDIVWYANPYKISHGFEIQHHGNWKNAIGNLEALKRYSPNCKLFLVVREEKEIEAIKQLLGATLNTSIKVIEASKVEDWLHVLRSNKKALRRLLPILNKIFNFGLVD